MPRIMILPTIQCIKCGEPYLRDVRMSDNMVAFAHQKKWHPPNEDPCSDEGKTFEVSIANFYKDLS